MSFFVDTNVVVYAATEGPYRDACLRILDAVARGAEARTSTAVVEEAWHIELSGRAGDLDGLARSAYALFTPLLAVTDEGVSAALALRAPAIGANDRLHVATCALNGIDTIVSADTGFDDVRGIRRVDPLDGHAVDRLLRISST
jgi:predicted nucleic acid-binding protein